MAQNVVTTRVRLPDAPRQYDQRWGTELIRQLDHLQNVLQPLISQGWTPISNVHTRRSFDANTVTLAELASTLATLINDMTARGMLSAVGTIPTLAFNDAGNSEYVPLL